MKKKLIFFVVLFLFGLIISYFFNILPIVTESKALSHTNKLSKELIKGDSVNIFDKYDFNVDNYSLYVVCSSSEKLKFSKVLFTDEKAVLNKMKEAFKFTYTGGDIATCESYLYLKKDNEIVFKTGIVLEGVIGIQSEKYGWLEFKDDEKLKEVFKQLEPIYLPIIKI
jgi:hypothetical protein